MKVGDRVRVKISEDKWCGELTGQIGVVQEIWYYANEGPRALVAFHPPHKGVLSKFDASIEGLSFNVERELETLPPLPAWRQER